MPEDEHLIGVPFMSGGELQEFVDSLSAMSFDVHQGLAIGEMFRGEWQSCPGIRFTPTRSNPMNRGWKASVAPEREESDGGSGPRASREV